MKIITCIFFFFQILWCHEDSYEYLSIDTFLQIVILLFIIASFLIYRYISISRYNKRLEKTVEKATYDLKKKNKMLLKEYKKQQELLEGFRSLIDTAMEAIIVFDENRIIIEVNQTALNLFGFHAKEDGLGYKVVEFVPAYEMFKLNKALMEEVTLPYELDLYTKEKKIFPVLAAGRYFQHDGKKYRITTLVDLSDVKEKEKLLLHQNKLASMGEMINMIAHQWRQPLNILGSINMKVEMMLELGHPIEKEPYKKISHEINHQLEFMSKTIDDFRDFYRPENKESFFIYNEVVDFVLNIIGASNKKHNIEVLTKLQSKNEIFTFEGGIKQVLMSLVKNAQDVLVTRKIEKPYIFIKTYDTQDSAIIEVLDNGEGVEESIINKIFEPYFTTKNELNGTGLGLYMSKVIIEQHCNGSLDVENTQDGAKFKISLRVSK